MPISTVLHVFSTGFALLAVAVSTYALVTARRLTRWHQWPLDSITKLQSCFDEHDVELRQHHERIRRINARLAARDRRSGERTLPDGDDDFVTRSPGMADKSTGFARQPGESDLDWKRRMRAAIATGTIKHG